MAVIGESLEIEVTVKDDTGVVVDLTLATGILCALYFNGNKIISKWSSNTKTGYDDLTVTDVVNGLFSVFLQTSKSLTALPKDAYLEVHVSFSNVNFDSSQQTNIDTKITLETFEQPVLIGVNPY